MESRDKETFQFTYSAREQEEIKEIRRKYDVQKQPEDKMTQLRRLDAGVTQKATAVSLAVGITGALLLGFGMSLVTTDLPQALNGLHGAAMPIGIAAGALGIIVICLAYPIYKRIVKTQRKRIAPEILRLTDELMK